MKRKITGILMLALALGGCAGSGKRGESSLAPHVDNEERTASFRMRDRYRHPLETLQFFGVRKDMTVVEIWPAPGWYSEILAPYLRDTGKFIAAGFAVSWEGAPQWRADAMNELKAKYAAKPLWYDQVEITEIGKPDRWEAAPPGSADLVLTFRNVHNWIAGEYAREMFGAFYRALKPGGVLGVVEHRAAPGTDAAEVRRTGYVTEDQVIALAQEAGFRLEAKSEINANPKDTKDYPGGVWTLPPALKLGEQDRQKYLDIGESDRMTLKFVKPGE